MVLSASSALEVIDYIDEYHVDIVIADINMPVIDGLTLAKRLKEDNPRTKVIMLTGYDEFSYAKKGIDIGVDGYLLKPVDGEAIEQELERILREIKKDINQRALINEIMEQVKEEKPYLKERFLLDYIFGFVSEKELAHKCRYFGVKEDADSYQLAIIEFCQVKQDITDFNNAYETLYKWKAVLSDMLSVHVFSDSNRRVFLFGDGNDIDGNDLLYIIKGIKEDDSYDVKIGISSSVDTVFDYSKMLNEATDALNYSSIKGKNTICDYREIGIKVEGPFETTIDSVTLLSQQLDKLKLFIKSGLMDKMTSVIDEIFEMTAIRMNRDKGNGVSILKAEMASIISLIQQLVYSTSKESQEVIKTRLEDDGNTMSMDYSEVDSIPKAKEMLLSYLNSICQCMIEDGQKKNLDMVDKVLVYINENYCNSNLSLKATAAEFFINPDYLSRIFKKKLNVSFKEYVFNKRMERAVKLIAETELRSYQIGEAVGIIDPNYFSVCFKKYMNMSISDYKKKS